MTPGSGCSSYRVTRGAEELYFYSEDELAGFLKAERTRRENVMSSCFGSMSITCVSWRAARFTVAIASWSSTETGRPSALAGGRSSLMVATAPSTSTRTNSPRTPLSFQTRGRAGGTVPRAARACLTRAPLQ